MKVLILVLLVALSAAKYIRQNHDYWYTAGKSSATQNVPFVDYSWNYCDKKCLYLKNFADKSTEFVVIQFQASSLKPDFAACYAKDSITGNYTIWRDVVKNAWFDKNCGADNEDWFVKYKTYKEVPSKEILDY
jgi:hypothetical protein